MDSTSAPEFRSKYTVYRLGNNKGFRVVGAITQDLDLFRMPVILRIDTDGRTEEKHIEVVGTYSPFSVETFEAPRRISIDPDNHVLTNSKDIKLRSSIVRGQGLTTTTRTERSRCTYTAMAEERQEAIYPFIPPRPMPIKPASTWLLP